MKAFTEEERRAWRLGIAGQLMAAQVSQATVTHPEEVRALAEAFIGIADAIISAEDRIPFGSYRYKKLEPKP